mmetsp:Transcript_20211/g.29992  ORF Transcript_20211/g.29992 Transcript_20211/m.29992 type:complete len:370 (+) Transcript_20211:19-1128(+)
MSFETSKVPSALLHSFFQEATNALNELCYSKGQPKSLFEQRKQLLRVQQACLERVADNFDGVSIEEAQIALKGIGVPQDTNVDALIQELSEKMTLSARLAFARLVLQQELIDPKYNITPSESNELCRSDILEFCGLCKAVVQLPDVVEFMVNGRSLYGEEVTCLGKELRFPQDRLELVQSLYLQALGHDSNGGTKELQRIMFSPKYYEDKELHEVFGDTVGNMRVALTNAGIAAQQKELNDFEEGGVTRVVSVSYSDKGNDECNGEAPQTETMHSESHLRLAGQAAALEQSLLERLKHMDERERESILDEAQHAHDKMIQDIQVLEPGPERIQFMTNQLSKETRELLLIHKIWQGLLTRNNGAPPRINI